ncbi:hypothetical protein [Streptosporangium sp. KLBMP 9127]|nr:hypothetical protein [Streptosporangium sp. KLBMP 9127]
MLEYFAHYVLTLRNVFLSVGTVLLVIGGVISFGDDARDQHHGAVLLQMAVVVMLGAIACAISDLRGKQ